MKKKTSPIPIICNSRGWALVYALVFCLLIQAVALLSSRFITHDLRAGGVFRSLLSLRHAPGGAAPAVKATLGKAPEGWDHACFVTEVTERSWNNESVFSWRARLGRQPSQGISERSLSSWRPHVILLVDDSRNMLTSSGDPYGNDGIFLERSTREIVPCRERDDFSNLLVATEGTYFRTAYGNLSKQVMGAHPIPDGMQCWTQAISRLTDLVESLDMCPMAVATVSKGLVQPFTTDRKALLTALGNLRPQAEDAKLSEACLAMVSQFPETCGTAKHIVVATSGIAVKDGNIPASIREFDNDHDLNDKAMDENSRCLDDVAAYAASKGILVHAVGPATDFVKAVASKGKGAYMPSKGSFAPPAPFICQVPALFGTVRRAPVNVELAFAPDWVSRENASFLKLMTNAPLHLAPSGSFTPKGAVSALSAAGQTLYCMTSRDDLLAVDMNTGSCSWVARGAGGMVEAQDKAVVAGPNMEGDILCLSGAPAVSWSAKGDCFALGPGAVYIARGPSLSACALAGGAAVAGIDLGSPVRIVGYDPCTERVMAASGNDLVYLLSRDLKIQGFLNPDLPYPLDLIRTFHLRKTLHLIVTARNHVACLTPEKTLWKIALEEGVCTSALVMDSKLYLTTWAPGECGGIDSGSAFIHVLDVKTGGRISSTPMFGSLSLGPLVDMDAGVIEYWSPGMERYQLDIKGLAGMKPLPLGARIKQASAHP